MLTHYCFPCKAEVKSAWSYIPLPHTLWCLIRHKHNFILTFTHLNISEKNISDHESTQQVERRIKMNAGTDTLSSTGLYMQDAFNFV
jgi:hypothetical protein